MGAKVVNKLVIAGFVFWIKCFGEIFQSLAEFSVLPRLAGDSIAVSEKTNKYQSVIQLFNMSIFIDDL